MKIYLADFYRHKGYVVSNLESHEKNILDKNIEDVLGSYFYINKEKVLTTIREEGRGIFVDSGAFSAFTLGSEIRLKDYVNFLHENSDIVRKEDGIYLASVLDSIGNAEKTLENQKAMEEMGIRPLPCFHFNEDEKYLKHYIKNYDYITLGGLAGKPVKTVMPWLDRIWNNYLLDNSGKARLKVHGFGLTSVPIMERYPWHSVDSSSWIQGAIFGKIFIRGTYISISEKRGDAKTLNKNFVNFSDIEKKEITNYVSKFGFCVDRLTEHWQVRCVYNIAEFKEKEIKINEKEKPNLVYGGLF